MVAIIITVNYLPFHRTERVTASCHSQVHTERSNKPESKEWSLTSQEAYVNISL